MTGDWIRVEPAVVLATHDQQISEHGGQPGIRDLTLIESALARPRNRAAYSPSEVDLFDLAAEYGYGLARNHGFVDGNKRTAYVTTILFLRLNRRDLAAPAVERVLVFEKLGKGELSPGDFAAWLREHAE